MRRWQEINSTMDNLDIEQFAQTLRQLGERYDTAPLKDYAENLYRKSSTFKLTEMASAFAQFPSLVVRLTVSGA
jgi:hypothetical protein